MLSVHFLLSRTTTLTLTPLFTDSLLSTQGCISLQLATCVYGDDGSRTRVLTSSSNTLITCVVRLTTSTNERTHVLKYHLPFKTYLQAWACSSQKGNQLLIWRLQLGLC